MSILASESPLVRSNLSPPRCAWQQVLKSAVREPAELCRLLGLGDFEAGARRAAADFPLFAPRGFIARMRPGDPRDPLLRQVLPLEEELAAPPGFSHDAVGDGPATLVPGLLQKYASRALIVATGACAVHCRYCFRRAFPYADAPRSPATWHPALERLAADTSLHEVILSGGDPLTLIDAQLAELAERLATIGHVRRLRVHTRLPIMIPERVTDELLGWLRGTRLTPIMVVHANHPAEIDDHVAAALARLVDAGIPLLNQAVLLRGVNDDVETLIGLSERLVELRVMPYYLHQLDRVLGAAHFEVPEAVGRQLIEQLRARLPGYAVPQYVREMAGAASKVPLAL